MISKDPWNIGRRLCSREPFLHAEDVVAPLLQEASTRLSDRVAFSTDKVGGRIVEEGGRGDRFGRGSRGDAIRNADVLQSSTAVIDVELVRRCS